MSARDVLLYRMLLASGSAAAALGVVDAVVFSGRYASCSPVVAQHVWPHLDRAGALGLHAAEWTTPPFEPRRYRPALGAPTISIGAGWSRLTPVPLISIRKPRNVPPAPPGCRLQVVLAHVAKVSACSTPYDLLFSELNGLEPL
jgi:hypothetical protein